MSPHHFLLSLGMTGGRGISGEQGPRGERGLSGEAGLPGLDGTPGPRGEEGPRGNQGEMGHGRSEIFTLHSFNHSIPECPQHSFSLWAGYSLVSLSSKLQPSPLSNPSSCMRRFSTLTTLGEQGPDKDSVSVWHAAAQDVESAGGKGGSDEVSRCAVCEVEGSLLTMHSMSTHLPSCPPSWGSLWSGFSYISAATVSEDCQGFWNSYCM